MPRNPYSAPVNVPVVSRPITARSGVLAVCAVTGATGVALVAIAWVTSAIGWLLVELPDAANDVVPELALALVGAVFLGLAVVGSVVPRARGALSRTRLVTALVAGSASYFVSVAGAGRFASRAVADVLSPVLDTPEMLRIPESDGRLMVLVGLALAVTSLVVVAVPNRDA